MKVEKCYSCGCKIEVCDDYKVEYCCDGHMCGCMGQPINPLFCDECEEKFSICQQKACN